MQSHIKNEAEVDEAGNGEDESGTLHVRKSSRQRESLRIPLKLLFKANFKVSAHRYH